MQGVLFVVWMVRTCLDSCCLSKFSVKDQPSGWSYFPCCPAGSGRHAVESAETPSGELRHFREKYLTRPKDLETKGSPFGATRESGLK